MNVSDMISELNDHGFDDASDTRKMSVINDTIWDVCARENWNFLEKSITLTFAGSSATASNFPTDFAAATAFSVSGSTNSNTLKYMRRDDWLRLYNNATSDGTPSVFYFLAGVMSFYPRPTSTLTVTMDYLCNPAALTTASLEASVIIPPQYHRSVIVNGALFKLYSMEDDTDIAPTFETYYERGISNMMQRNLVRQYQDNDFVHPVSADDLNEDYDSWYGL